MFCPAVWHRSINHTWKVSNGSGSYILQRINDAVFQHPGDIAENIDALALYLQGRIPGYLFVRPLSTLDGRNIVQVEKAFSGLVPFIEGSYTLMWWRRRAGLPGSRQFGKIHPAPVRVFHRASSF